MQRKRGIHHIFRVLMCFAAAFAIFFLGVCNGGELSESEAFFKFIQTVDPENVLRIQWNGFVPSPCSQRWKGVKCNLNPKSVAEIRLNGLNLSGTIDAESICMLPFLSLLSLARNHIHGSVPESISNCKSLTHLDLSGNFLNGNVPVALTRFKSLKQMDISDNHFNKFFEPRKHESNFPTNYVMDSTALGLKSPRRRLREVTAPPPAIQLENHPFQEDGNSYKKWTTWTLLFLGIAFFLLLAFFVQRKATKEARDKEILKALAHSPPKAPPTKALEEAKQEETLSELVFFVEEEERFNLEDLLEAAADLQSQSICSMLYKVKLKNSRLFAVKRLKKMKGSFEEFGQTMRRIGNLKHHNILPLVGFSSTGEERLLIYKYQSNGSLLTLFENYIEGKRDFPWKLRLCIAIGIARGLDFIYQRIDGMEIIPHGNIKLSNIILNENEEPLISEYGYAKYIDPKTASLLSSNGYTSPEKGFTEQADVFSFGVILLELLTGKIVEKTGVDLPKWVRSMVREEWTGEVFDREVSEVGMYAFPLLNLSLKCVAQSPLERPNIAEVLEKIEEIVCAHEDVSPSSLVSMESNPQDCCLIRSVVPETWDTPGSTH